MALGTPPNISIAMDPLAMAPMKKAERGTSAGLPPASRETTIPSKPTSGEKSIMNRP